MGYQFHSLDFSGCQSDTFGPIAPDGVVGCVERFFQNADSGLGLVAGLDFDVGIGGEGQNPASAVNQFVAAIEDEFFELAAFDAGGGRLKGQVRR